MDTDELKSRRDKLQAQIAAQQSVVDKLHNGTRAEDLEAARAKADEAAAQADQARQDLARVENAFALFPWKIRQQTGPGCGPDQSGCNGGPGGSGPAGI